MFDNIFAAIEKWMRELLTGMVESNMSTMFTDVNEKTSEIAAQVGRTPQNWNSSVFSMIQNLSESVVVPIAGIIITLVLCYELISMSVCSLLRCCSSMLRKPNRNWIVQCFRRLVSLRSSTAH